MGGILIGSVEWVVMGLISSGAYRTGDATLVLVMRVVSEKKLNDGK